jgi:uroporphyrinogen decarboxylase
LVKPELSVPLIGFSGSPWTLATYMVEGGASKQYSIIKKLLFSEPAVLMHLLDVLTQAVTDYLNAQIEAGVDVVMLFDSWGGVLGHDTYPIFSLDPMKKVIAGLQRHARGKKIPVILFTKNGDTWLEAMRDSGADALGIDWRITLGEARRRVGDQVALQGNLDPAILYGTPDTIRAAVKTAMDSFGKGPGHIFNLGHGMLPDVPFENVQVLVDAVHDY